MNKQFVNLLFILAICFVAYLLFRNIDFKEGMTSDDSGKTSDSTTSNGIAGTAQTYAANIKSNTIKNQDVLLVAKYRKDYENVILNLDDLVNTMMLETTLSVNTSDPLPALDKLVKMHSAKTALNSVMKFVDATK